MGPGPSRSTSRLAAGTFILDFDMRFVGGRARDHGPKDPSQMSDTM